MMYILIDENNYIVAASWGAAIKSGIEVEDFKFEHDIQSYQYINGKIVLDKKRLQQLQSEQKAQEELQGLQEIISETDAVALQRWEESELGLEHEMPEQEFQEVMKKRQETRTKLRQLKAKEQYS